MRGEVKSSREYAAIQRWYAGRAAGRSGVPLMRHIDDGLRILEQIDASLAAGRAFCLHPLLQAEADLIVHAPRIADATDDPYLVVLAVEYRHIANAALSSRTLTDAADIALSPLADVNAMLVADKVQNRKDFQRHHEQHHPRRAELARYFELWLERLGIDEARYAQLAAEL